MDFLTQAILGAAIGEMILGKRLGNRAMAWGVVLSLLPNLDALLAPGFDHANWLWWHRGPSHSLLVAAIASLLLAKPLAKRWRGDRIGPVMAGGFTFLVLFCHIVADSFNTHGTLAMWPFVSERVAFNNLSYTDPFFALPMLIGLIWIAFLRQPKQLPIRRRINLVCLLLSCAYIGLSFGAKSIVSKRFESDLATQGIEYHKRFESPTRFNILLWRSAVDCGDHILVGHRSILDGSRPMRWVVYPKGREATNQLGESRELKLVQHFTSDWWICRPHAKGLWVGDLRFDEMREWGSREGMVDYRLAYHWDLLPAEAKDRLRPKPRHRVDLAPMLRRLASRTMGKREDWDAMPRLEGVTGSLPEMLLTQP